MQIVNRDKNNYLNNKIILLIMALFVMATWFFTRWLTVSKEFTGSFLITGIAFNKVQTITILVYSLITIFLMVIKVSPTYIVLFSIFSIASTYPPIYLEHFKRDYYLTYYFTYGLAMINLLIINFKNGYKFNMKLLLPVIILLAYSLFSIVWSNNLVYGANFFAVMAQGYLAYVLLNNLKEKINFNDLAWFFSFLLLIISSQYLTLISVKILRGENFFVFLNDKGVIQYIKLLFTGTNGKTHLFRLWANPNIVAGVVGISFIPSLYKYFNKDRSKFVYLFIPFEILFIAVIFFTKSKGLLFGYVIGLIMIIPTLIYKDYKKTFILFLGIITSFILFVTTVVLLKDTYPIFFQKIDGFSTLRFSIYEKAINQLKDPMTLFFGSGLGASKNNISNFYYHSWIFNTLTNLGLVGLGLTLFMIYQAFKIALTSKEGFSIFFLMGMLVYLSHGIFDVGYDYQFIGVIYYGVLALIERNNRIDNMVTVLHVRNSETDLKIINLDI